MTVAPPRRFPPAQTVCALCASIYPAHDVHTCTNPPERNTMHYPTTAGLDTGEKGIVLPGERNRHQEIRLACLRLAAETGMPTDQIHTTAEHWATWVLGTNQKEN